mgnify:CR=1 FL=1
MKNLRYSIGIDVSKNDFKACLSVINEELKVTIKGSKSFTNTNKGFNEFYIWVTKLAKEPLPLFYTMEATGIYHEGLAWFLFEKEAALCVMLPNKAKRYMQSLGIRSKTDSIDAQGLSRMGAEQHLPLWQPLSKNLYKLRSLTRHLESLQGTKTALKNQLEAVSYAMYTLKSVAKSLKSTIKSIDKQIDFIKHEIIKMMEEDAVLSVKVKCLTSIKGVSSLTAAVLIAETNGFELFENQRQLTSYAGYDVVENQSGTHRGKSRISKKGNSHIRRAMHMPAFNVVKYKVKPFEMLYQRVYDRTKCKMKAYVAVQRKLLIIAYTLWKAETMFDPEYTISKETSGNQESKPLFSGSGPQGTEKKTATVNVAALDELPCNLSPEALFSVDQI